MIEKLYEIKTKIQNCQDLKLQFEQNEEKLKKERKVLSGLTRAQKAAIKKYSDTFEAIKEGFVDSAQEFRYYDRMRVNLIHNIDWSVCYGLDMQFMGETCTPFSYLFEYESNTSPELEDVPNLIISLHEPDGSAVLSENMTRIVDAYKQNPEQVIEEYTLKRMELLDRRTELEIAKTEKELKELTEEYNSINEKLKGKKPLKENGFNMMFRKKRLVMQSKQKNLPAKIKRLQEKADQLKLVISGEKHKEQAREYATKELEHLCKCMKWAEDMVNYNAEVRAYYAEKVLPYDAKIESQKQSVENLQKQKQDTQKQLKTAKFEARELIMLSIKDPEFMEQIKQAKEKDFSKDDWKLIQSLKSLYERENVDDLVRDL
ncbi:MAG: hypothetical protein IJA69_01115 [Clostridia bacterium]|nr:hypothetical protein [Clostridia bacterium]